jgi:hypothetical protein
MPEFPVLKPCFHGGQRYAPDEPARQTITLDDAMIIEKYRYVGYIGTEIQPGQKGRRKVKRAKHAK